MADFYDSIPGERRYSGHEVYEDEYTPPLRSLRVAWVAAAAPDSTDEVHRLQAMFDRAIAAHDREVAAKAWDEGYVRGRHPWTKAGPWRDPSDGFSPPATGWNRNPYRDA